MGTLISTEKFSMSPRAIYERTRRLTDDKADNLMRAAIVRCRNKKKAEKIIKHANGDSAFSNTTRNKYLTTRIAHHLSKGRSIADIVIRENAPASLVQQLVKSMEVAK